MESAVKQQPEVSIRDLMEAGAHFGHPTAKWNPKMKPFIHHAQNGVYIINLQKTVTLFRDALEGARRIASTGQKVLFVGTKKQSRDIIKEEAVRAGQLYMTERWIGGTLTNFHTIKRSINFMKTLQKMAETKAYGIRKKKEILTLEKRREKLETNLLGIQNMTELPGALFVIDPHLEYIAVKEAQSMNIPIFAVVDTNCDPEGIQYPIPGNDDSIRAIKLYVSKIADAIISGQKVRDENLKKMTPAATTAAAEPREEKKADGFKEKEAFKPQVVKGSRGKKEGND